MHAPVRPVWLGEWDVALPVVHVRDDEIYREVLVGTNTRPFPFVDSCHSSHADDRVPQSCQPPN